MRAGWLLLGMTMLSGGCNAALPTVAPHCLAPRGTAAVTLPPHFAEAIAATLLKDGPTRLLLRDDADAAIIDMDGLIILLPPTEMRATREAITAALAPLSPEVRASTWDRTAVVVWLGRGHGDQADPTPRLAWDPGLRLNLVHDDLTDTGCLVRVVTPNHPQRSLTPKAAKRIGDRAAGTEAKLLEALKHVAAPLPEAEVADRRARDWARLFTSGIWAERRRTLPITAAILLVVLLVFFVSSLDGFWSAAELKTEALEQNGALIVPPPPGQRYRLLSFGLLHAGLSHLANNAIALYIGSFLLEPALGAPRTILVFFAGMIASGVARRLLQKPVILVGASGGIFALEGAALGLILLPAAWVPVVGRAGFLIMLGVMLAIGLLLSFLPTISLLGHLVGALTGFLLAVTGAITIGHPPLDGGAESPLVTDVTWALAGVALAAWIAAGIWARRRPPPIAPESEVS